MIMKDMVMNYSFITRNLMMRTIVFMFIVCDNHMVVEIKRKYNLRYHMKLLCIARRKEEI